MLQQCKQRTRPLLILVIACKLFPFHWPLCSDRKTSYYIHKNVTHIVNQSQYYINLKCSTFTLMLPFFDLDLWCLWQVIMWHRLTVDLFVSGLSKLRYVSCYYILLSKPDVCLIRMLWQSVWCTGNLQFAVPFSSDFLWCGNFIVHVFLLKWTDFVSINCWVCIHYLSMLGFHSFWSSPNTYFEFSLTWGAAVV